MASAEKQYRQRARAESLYRERVGQVSCVQCGSMNYRLLDLQGEEEPCTRECNDCGNKTMTVLPKIASAESAATSA